MFARAFGWTCIATTVLLAGVVPEILAAPPASKPFGKTAEGVPVELYTLQNTHGMTVRVMTRGATIVDLIVPDKKGQLADVSLGFDDVAGYESSGNQYFGCTTGRVANRIAGGKFKLDGQEYVLAVNNGPNSLHGGKTHALDKVVWKAFPADTPDGQAVSFQYQSPHGEEGYPGNLDLTVTFLVKRARNELVIDYTAASDRPTPVNLTNHMYFNLAGEGSDTVLDHVLQIHADSYTPTDDTLIPTGKIEPVAGLPIDFRQPHRLGERIAQLDNWAGQGYDHNFVVNGSPEALRPVARLKDPASGRVLEIECDEPAVQLYTGNHLHGQAGKAGKPYPRRSAVCLESQHFPDSVNHPQFPTTILKPGDAYRQTCIWRFTAE
jgi:aldose 1-epimerase